MAVNSRLGARYVLRSELIDGIRAGQSFRTPRLTSSNAACNDRITHAHVDEVYLQAPQASRPRRPVAFDEILIEGVAIEAIEARN